MVDAVIFDMDGVLVDSEPLDREAWAVVLPRYGVHMAEEEIRSFTGRPTIAVLEHIRSNHGVPLADDVLTEKMACFQAIAAEKLTAMPGVLDFLDRLKSSGTKMAVASSSSHDRIQFSLTHTGLIEYFDALCSGEDVVHHKPAPDVYLYAAGALRVDPGRCSVVEDSIYGIMAAKAAGMKAYGYTSSFPAQDLKQAGADVIFDAFEELGRYF